MTASGTGGSAADPDGGGASRISNLGRNVLVLTVITAVVGAVATGWTTTLFEDDPPPTCPGDDCEGRNPETAGCGEDAVGYQPLDANPASLQVRYSPRCHAVWGRITAGEPGDTVSAVVTDGGRWEAEILWGEDTFTKMTTVQDDDFEVEVCATPIEAADREGDWAAYCIRATEESPFT